MKYSFVLYFLCLGLFEQCVTNEDHSNAILHHTTTNTYFSKTIEDPYQHLENLKDTTVLSWLNYQNDYTRNILQNISGRQKLLERIKENDEMRSEAVFNLKVLSLNAYYYLKYSDNHEANILYFQAGIDGAETELFNSENYKKTSKHKYIINYFQPSWNGKKIAIGFTKNDEEFSEVVIYDVATKTFHDEIIDHCWPSELGGINWLDDNSGFTYLHIPDIDTTSPNYILDAATVVYRLGDNPKDLHIIFSRKTHPQLNLKPADFPIVNIFGKNQKYMFGRVGGIGFKDYYYAPTSELENETVSWKPLFKKKHKIEKFLPYQDEIYFLSAQKASNFSLFKTSFDQLNFDTPTEVVPALANEILKDFVITSEGLFYTTTKNGVSASLFRLEDATVEKITLPAATGSISLSSIATTSPALWIETESWISHRNRYRYNVEKKTFVKENVTPVVKYPELEDIVVKEIEIASHDGVKVPLSIIYRKGMLKNGKNRMLLNGYGSYNWINAPMLYPYLLYWIAEGGVYAVAHVRGGGEKGEQWHKAGYKTTKPNTWKDFIACTEYLIDKGYTSPEKFAVWGGSAGGINIGRAVTERPDLYAVAIIRVGLLNTLRSEIAPNGQNNIKEFGTIKDSIEFEALLEMDAYHHVEEDTHYPAMLLTAGINDSRVAAWQPAKFAARVQVATSSGSPVLLSINFDEGHGFDRTQKSKREELADIISFALWQTGSEKYRVN
ncbi:prolyl oligopeptidase family serine peptidase [Kordia algicida OT-1]|uniref:prolyl oligopeptidase n=1 Tax=Kordia algicida OT-1 TaxID=391587 RepID=A9DQA9_9FLAO|nr:prolyl oligopeptidase family serine peptidase [Kordia algicida]EDP96615.1 prolyl oligopeptidase family protein [Kordia algicida OT-1]